MTPERIARLRSTHNEVSAQPRMLASRFYHELFASTPALRALFPADLTSLQGHFEAAALQDSLRDLGAQHVDWGAKPTDYFLVREALIRAIRSASSIWNDEIESDWRQAISAIAVPMLQGAAVRTAIIAEELADESQGTA